MSIKSDFCLQLAPLIATTETILAGQVSPWPIAPLWWRSVFLAGAGLATYSVIANHQIKSTPQNIATAVLAYLAADGASRTAGSAVSTAILKKKGKTHIIDIGYHMIQYTVLALLTGVTTSSTIHEILLHTSVEPARARFISVISAIAASTLSQTISTHNAGFNIGDSVFFIATPGAVAGIGAGIGAGGGGTGYLIGAMTGAIAGTLTGISFAAISSGEGFEGLTEVAAVGLIEALTANLSIFTIKAISILASDNSHLKIAGAATIATSFAFALINSLSGFAVYGYPLEQSLSKTTQTLWNKFLAPLDYLATLFPQLFSESEHEL